MKKAVGLVILLCIVLAVATLSGCNNNKTVTLRYAAWNLEEPGKNSLERRMIKAFMEEYPYIKVEIDEDFGSNYDGALKAAAARNDIPDVFMYSGNPQAYANGWCADVTDIAGKDNEWGNIPLSLRESATIKGKIVAVPSSMHLYGYFCNESLFEKKKAELPKAGLTVEQFKTAVGKMTDINNGSIGLADESSIIEWYPASINSQLGWYSWDGGKFNLNSREFTDGVKLAKSMCENHQTYALLSGNERKNLKGSNDWEAWNSGTVAMKFDGTWSVNNYSKLPFKVSFIGIPGGRACIVPDFMFISKNSRHPEDAYKFIKFMSAYSREGFSKRMELAKANNLTVSTIPITKDNRLIDEYFESIKIDGIREVYKSLSQGSYVEGTKVLPGYNQARWEYPTNIQMGNTRNAKIGDVLINTYRGNMNIDEIADQIDSAANECIQIYPRPVDN